MDSAHEADLVNAITPRWSYLQLGDLTNEVPKCKMQFPAAKIANNLPLLAATAYLIIVVKSDANSNMDVMEGYGVVNSS
jgi:hypothetical protein